MKAAPVQDVRSLRSFKFLYRLAANVDNIINNQSTTAWWETTTRHSQTPECHFYKSSVHDGRQAVRGEHFQHSSHIPICTPTRLYVIRSTATTRRTIHDGINMVLDLLSVSHKEKWAVRCNFYRSSLVNVRTVQFNPQSPLSQRPLAGRRHSTCGESARRLPCALSPSGDAPCILSAVVCRLAMHYHGTTVVYVNTAAAQHKVVVVQ